MVAQTIHPRGRRRKGGLRSCERHFDGVAVEAVGFGGNLGRVVTDAIDRCRGRYARATGALDVGGSENGKLNPGGQGERLSTQAGWLAADCAPGGQLIHFALALSAASASSCPALSPTPRPLWPTQPGGPPGFARLPPCATAVAVQLQSALPLIARPAGFALVIAYPPPDSVSGSTEGMRP